MKSRTAGYILRTLFALFFMLTIFTPVTAVDAARHALTNPVTDWNSFLGGADEDKGYAIAVDADGNTYITGYSNVTWGSPVRAYSANSDAFVAKLDSNGDLVWNTFLGGGGFSYGNAIALDQTGNVYVTGHSLGSWGSPVNNYTVGDADVFAVKLDNDGNLLWNTFHGSSDSDYGRGITLDNTGNIYLTGYSFDTWGSPVTAHSSPGTAYDGVVVQLNNNGGLVWNTFMGAPGGDGYDYCDSIAIDPGTSDIYIAGSSNQTWGAPIISHASPGLAYDGFAAKLNSSGVRQWNTFMGSGNWDVAEAIAINGSHIYIAGSSSAAWGSGAAAYAGDDDAFVTELDINGNRLWNTFMGSADYDRGYGIAVDGDGNILITGESRATWASPQNAHAGGGDAFVAQLNTSGTLDWNSFVGSSVGDRGVGIAALGNEHIYLAGWGGAEWGTPQRNYSAGLDAFVVQLGDSSPEIDVQRPVGTSIADGGTDDQSTKMPGNQVTLTYTVENTGSANLTVSAITSSSATNVTVDTIAPGNLTVAAGSTATFSVSYTPASGSGAFSFELDISSDDSDEGNYDITVSGTRDGTAPSVTIDQGAAQLDPTNTSPITFDVVFSEPVVGFTNADVNIVGMAGSPGITVTGSDANYTVTVTGMADGETITATIPANAAQDTAGNYSTASTSTDNSVDYDNSAPTVLNTLPENNAILLTAPTQIQIEFSENVTIASAEDTANYLLLTAGNNQVFDTLSCDSGVLGDDLEVPVNTAVYDGSDPFIATLDINNGTPLPINAYRLYICGTTSIEDLAGFHLNNGLDSLLNFIIAPSTLPATGFRQGMFTLLPKQPAAKTYVETAMVLEVPDLGVNMPIVGVPYTDSGWDVTWLGNSAGYLYGSASPTWAGNTVLTGHVWDANNNPGPFANLKTLQYGDQIKIKAWGQIYTYKVIESKLILPRSINNIFGHEERDYLTLLTCEFYNPLNGNYSMRRMVKAVLVKVE